MPKSEAGMPTSKSKPSGFTLIEILVVLVILGITTSVAMLSFGDFGRGRRIGAEADRFIQKVRLVRYHAILEATPYAIKITPTDYSITQFSGKKAWQSTSAASLAGRAFPAQTSVHLKLTEASKKHPIIIQASGEMTPFTLGFGPMGKPPIIQVVGKKNGTLSLQQIQSKP